MDNRIPFHKTYTNSHDLVNLLQSRGLAVAEPTKAERYLEYIGYYRLSAYMYPLLQIPKEQHQYKQGAKFSQVMTLYRFDKKLRLFLFNEIEKIEVAVRSAFVNRDGINYHLYFTPISSISTIGSVITTTGH